MIFIFTIRHFDMRAGPTPANQPSGDRPRRFGDCLAGTALLAHGQKLMTLNQRLRQRLPALFDQQVMLADIRAGRAVFVAPSSARAARLRLEQRQLRSLLAQLGEQAETIVVKVVLPQRACAPATPISPLSPAAAVHLQAAAASMSDPELKAQFLALASLAE